MTAEAEDPEFELTDGSGLYGEIPAHFDRQPMGKQHDGVSGIPLEVLDASA
jgi:hypothetical protein